LNNQSTREKLTYRIIHLNDNTYLLSGLKVTDLTAMTFPVVIDPSLTIYTDSEDGYPSNSSSNYNTVWNATTSSGFASFNLITIGQNKVSGFPTSTYTINRGYLYFDTSVLPSNAIIDNATLSLYKCTDYSTTEFDITVQNGQPTHPHNPLDTADYDKDNYSGDGGDLNTTLLDDGYNNLTLNDDGISWINQTGEWTKLCLRSSKDINGYAPTGNEYISFYTSEQGAEYTPKLIINYRNQSKIKNTGLTNIKGYILTQVQFYNTTQETWVVEDDTVNETSPTAIEMDYQLPLDRLFNDQIMASDLKNGEGLYRVYTEFRDPSGNVLRTNDGTELKAWWEFTKT
jgi:hypothetical protein